MQHIYGLFGFEFKLELSTRPDNYLGSIETWNEAEAVRDSCPCCSDRHIVALTGHATACLATQQGTREAVSRPVGDQPRRRRVLRTQD